MSHFCGILILEGKKMTRETFLKKAKKEKLKIHKNNINKAEPLHKVCGNLKTKYPASIEVLLEGR